MFTTEMEKRLVLNSWKEIADYMGRGVRTVQRYERDLRLPVHRPAGKSRSAVVAFGDEIDLWMRRGRLRSLTNGDVEAHAHTDLPEWKRLIANSELLLKRADALKTSMSQLLNLIKETDRRRKLMLNQRPPRDLSQALVQRTEALQTKMNELSELMRGGEKAK